MWNLRKNNKKRTSRGIFSEERVTKKRMLMYLIRFEL